MGDLSSQDSILRAMVAERQTLQEQRDNIQAAYEARSNNNDDDTHWGSLSPGELLGLEGWLSWYDTKIAALDALLIPRPQISMPLQAHHKPPGLGGRTIR